MTDTYSGETLSDEMKRIRETLKRLEQKAELSSSAYLRSTTKLKALSNKVIIISLIATFVLSFLSLLLTFSPGLYLIPSQIIGVVLGFAALATAIFSMSDKIFGWNEKISSYDFGFKILRRFIRDSQWFRKTELESLDDDEAREKALRLENQYALLVGSLPPNGLSDKEFLECKKNMLLKIRVSKMLDENPCLDIEKAYNCIKAEIAVKEE